MASGRKPTPYFKGEKIGKFGHIFLEELELNENAIPRDRRVIKAQCAVCEKEFINTLHRVKNVNKSCGCLRVTNMINYHKKFKELINEKSNYE